jgi:transposase
MAQALEVSLTTEQEKDLTWARDHHEKSYLRVKCAAILKVASGYSIRQVARTGLLKAVRQETVSDWIQRYLAEGLDGLLVRAGRGRKPAFSPCGSLL